MKSQKRPPASCIVGERKWKARKGIGAAHGPKGGSPAYHQCMFGLPIGPCLINDFAAWPLDACCSLFTSKATEDSDALAAARFARLQASLSGGLVMHTDYSGELSPETAMRILGVSCLTYGMALPCTENNKLPWLIFWRSCDVDATCQEVALGNKYVAEHVACDIMDR